MRLVASLSLPLFGVALAFLGACTEPVPPSANGAYDVSFEQNSANCGQKGHHGKVGVITESTKTTVAVDGVEGASISCSVAGAGTGPFAVTGQIISGSNVVTINVPAISSTATAAMPAEGSASFLSVTSGDTYNSSETTKCAFYFLPGTPQAVSGGKIWVSFKCDVIVSPPSECALGESYILLENCDE